MGTAASGVGSSQTLPPVGTGDANNCVFGRPAPPYFEQRWYAAYTCARHEKRVAEQLRARSVELFLPLFRSVRRWKNGPAIVDLPLFPGYVFVRIALRDRMRVLQVPSVVRLVGFDGQPAAMPDEEIQSLQDLLARTLRAEPHPYLTAGRRVRVLEGPLQGREGVILRKKNRARLVISVDLIQRSVAVEMEERWLQLVL
jgi:transcription antitermination factor NusG